MDTWRQINDQIALKSEVLAKFVGAIPVAFIVADDMGLIYLINHQTELLFGYDQTELIGQPVEILIPENLREIHVKHRVAYAEAPHSRAMGSGSQLKARKKSGEEFLAEIMLGPLVTTEGTYIMVMIMRHSEDSHA
jgi:PAS domain S-box-containing protein